MKDNLKEPFINTSINNGGKYDTITNVNDTKDGPMQHQMRAPSDFQLFMITVKLFFGISYLSMPNTVSQCGLIGGAVLFLIVIGINGITMLQLVKISE